MYAIKDIFFNPINCDCECDKSCGIGEYLDYSNSKCRIKLIDPLVEKCTANINETRLVNKILEKNENIYETRLVNKTLEKMKILMRQSW